MGRRGIHSEEVEDEGAPNKKMKVFRVYDSAVPSAVRDHYKAMRQNQTVESVRFARARYGKLKSKMGVWEAFDTLSGFIDVSDPDVDIPNAHHLFQSAEGARMDGQPDWMQFIALIHDLGKCIYLRGCDEDGTSVSEQWAVVGDTFVVSGFGVWQLHTSRLSLQYSLPVFLCFWCRDFLNLFFIIIFAAICPLLLVRFR